MKCRYCGKVLGQDLVCPVCSFDNREDTMETIVRELLRLEGLGLVARPMDLINGFCDLAPEMKDAYRLLLHFSHVSSFLDLIPVAQRPYEEQVAFIQRIETQLRMLGHPDAYAREISNRIPGPIWFAQYFHSMRELTRAQVDAGFSGLGHYRQADTEYWGFWHSGKREGYGILCWDVGSFYDGQWKDGKINGFGTQTWPNGERYEGFWKNAQMDGAGRYLYPDGRTLEGLFAEGLFRSSANTERKRKKTARQAKPVTRKMLEEGFTGYGRYEQDGDIYEGDFLRGEKCGDGTLTYRDGSVYTGSFRADQRDGSGLMIWSNGNRFEGSWKNGLVHGKGKLSCPDGSYFDGIYQNGKENGYGIAHWAGNGDYKGGFQDGLMHGHGRRSFPDGRVQEGTFDRGRFVGAEKKPKGKNAASTRIDTDHDTGGSGLLSRLQNWIWRRQLDTGSQKRTQD